MKMRQYYVVREESDAFDYLHGPCSHSDAYYFLQNLEYTYKIKIVYREIEVKE